MNLIDFTRKPYPLRLNKWGIIVSISLFISFFMLVFQPFGLVSLQSDQKSLLLAGYGLVTFMVLVLDMILLPLILPAVFKEEKWTVFREAVWLIWIVITISLGNYVYSDVLSIVHWVGLKGYLYFLVFTFSIAVIPITVVIFFSYNRLLKQNLRASQELNELIGGKADNPARDDHTLLISSENRKQEIEIPSSSLICLESEGNYVNAWYIEEGKIVRTMLRNTIKNIESQVEKADKLFKCHRAYIVNLSHILKVSGNSQGYRLKVKYLDNEIPVARNYSKPFREALKEY